eukprot:5033356-Ditylum_brightwellii.AAC.1
MTWGSGPQCDVVTKGIPFMCSLIEDGVSDVELLKWEKFWNYFDKQWIPLIDKWNICDEDGDIANVINWTNNGVESYNRRFNGLFLARSRPSM